MKFSPSSKKELFENEYFIKWLSNPDEESNRYWNRWLSENQEWRTEVEHVRRVVLALHQQESYRLEEEEKEKLLDNILTRLEKNKSKQLQGGRPISFRWIYYAAACLVMMGLMFGELNYRFFSKEKSDQISKPEVALIQKSTTTGTRSSFYLPDGTLVKLNAESSLEFPSEFSKEIREVKLTGQAYFEVTPNADAPFIVQTKWFDVKVLGTSFDVNAYEDSPTKNVAVLTGKVKVNTPTGKEATLTPNEMAEWDIAKDNLKVQAFDKQLITGWKDGILFFKNQKLSEVIGILEKWYGVQIAVATRVDLDQKITAKYDNEVLKNVLTGLSPVCGFEFELNARKVKIY